MHGTFTARRQARQHQSQRGVAVFPPTIVISITPLDRRGLQCILRRPAARIRSRQPQLDAARELVRLGSESLRARIGVAASLTVKERDRRGPVFEAWGPHPFSPVSPPVARTKPIAGLGDVACAALLAVPPKVGVCWDRRRTNGQE